VTPRPRDRAASSCSRLVALGGAALLGACAGLTPPPAGAPERARAARTYSASVRVSLETKALRGRARAIVAFARPDALRLELPGPAGVRCIAVAAGPRLSAVFPGERARWEGASTAEEMEDLLGVRLAPSELMDLLVGVPSPRVEDYRASWGEKLPRKLSATLVDGSRIKAEVETADLDPDLPAAAFEDPPSAGYRLVDAAEARRLLGIR
jgi:hypothetical protein